MEESEIWVSIPSLSGYEASSFGRIRSVDRLVLTKNGQTRRYSSKILSPSSKNQYGHLKVKTPNGVKYVHHLVGEAFHGLRLKGEVYCHNNGINSDNRKDNIRIDTLIGNSKDTVSHGTRLERDKHPMSVLSSGDVDEIRKMLSNGIKQREVASMFGVCRSTISAISTGRSWYLFDARHKGPTEFVGRV